MPQTPDTSQFMILGYAVFLVLPALFIASLWWRHRNLQRDEEMLQSLNDDDKKDK